MATSTTVLWPNVAIDKRRGFNFVSKTYSIVHIHYVCAYQMLPLILTQYLFFKEIIDLFMLNKVHNIENQTG